MMVTAIVLLPVVFGGLTLLMLASMRQTGKRRRIRKPGKALSHRDSNSGRIGESESDDGL